MGPVRSKIIQICLLSWLKSCEQELGIWRFQGWEQSYWNTYTKYFLANLRRQLTLFIYYSPNEFKLVAISTLVQNTVAFSTDEFNSNQLSWFYDFWLLVFHIITLCSALGVKELMLQFRAPVWKRRTTYPRWHCGKTGDITSGKVTWCPFFPWLSSRPHTSPQHYCKAYSFQILFLSLYFIY